MPAQIVAPPAGESVGSTFAYLAARASGAPLAQVVPGPDPANPYGTDPRGAAPPAFNAPPPQAPPNAPTGQTAPGVPVTAAVPTGNTVAAPAPPGFGSAPASPPSAPTVPYGTAPSAVASTSAAPNPAAVGPTRGPAVAALPPTNTGAPGTAAGPAPRVANPTASNSAVTSTTGTSSSGPTTGRIIPNLPATPTGQRIVNVAQSQLGARYTWAGVSPSTGFDCSGFVYWVFNQIGHALERTMPEQLAAGRRVRLEELRPGDLVFFSDTYTSGLSHNGIYVGDGKFIHAADETTGVVVTPLNSAYWEQRFVAAVRLLD